MNAEIQQTALRYRNLIAHIVRGKEKEIAEKSFFHCHCVGVHSLLFDDTPGARIRLFLATQQHELWKNALIPCDPTRGMRGGLAYSLSVGFHPHHCDIELECIEGVFTSVHANVLAPWRDLQTMLGVYRYESQINSGACSFSFERHANLAFAPYSRVVGDSLFLPAAQLHTIYVPAGERAAWFVHEGAEDPSYQPMTYSNVDLTTLDTSQLYKPVSVCEMLNLLRKFGLL